MLIYFLASTAFAKPTVTPLTSDRALPGEYAKIADEYGVKRLAPNDFAQTDSATRHVAKLLEKILIEKDGELPIDVVLVDDMRIGAFVHEAAGRRVVAVNLGLLRFVQNDDELAFVLGHELSHRDSTLQKEADAQKGTALGSLLGRTVENEVDARAAVERLHQNGFNPNAARHLFERLESVAGFGAGASHTSTNSRRDTLAFLTTALRRVFGEKVKADVPENYSRDTVRAIHEWIDSPSFSAHQAKRIAAAVGEAAIAKPTHMRPAVYESRGYGLVYPYDTEYESRLGELQRFLPDDLSLEKRVQIEIDLHRELSKGFRQAADALLAQRGRAVTLEDLAVISQMEKKAIRVRSLPMDGVAYRIQLAEDNISRLDYRAKHEADGEKAESMRSQIAAAKRDVANLQKALDVQKKFIDRAPRNDGYDETSLPQLRQIRADGASHLEAVLDGEVSGVLAGLRDPATAANARGLFESLPPAVARKHSVEAQLAVLDSARQVLAGHGQSGKIDAHEALLLVRFAYPIFGLKTLDERVAVSASVAEALQDLERRVLAANEPARGASLRLMMEILRGTGQPHHISRERFVGALHRGLGQTREIEQALSQYRKSLENFEKENGAPPAETRAEEARHLAELLDAHIESLAATESAELSPTQRRALAIARNPALNRAWRDARGEPGHLGFAEVLAELKVVLENPAAAARLAPPLSLGKLADHVLQSDRWGGPSGRYEGQDAVIESLWKLARDHRPHLTFYDDGKFLADTTETALIAFLSDSSKRGLPYPEEVLVPMFGKEWATKHDGPFTRYLGEYVKNKVALELKNREALPLRERVKQTALHFRAEVERAQHPEMGRYVSDAMGEVFPKDTPGRVECILGIADAKSVAPKGGAVSAPWSWLSVVASDPESLEKLPLATRTELFVAWTDTTGPGAAVDRLYESIWKDTEGHPEWREALRDPAFIDRLHFDANKRNLSRWQLEDRFALEADHRAIRAGTLRPPRRNAARDKIGKVAAFIDRQFPKKSTMKNEAIVYAQDQLVTNQTETRLLGRELIDAHNWAQSRELAALDAAHILNRVVNVTQYQRYELLEYLVGRRPDPPSSVINEWQEEKKKSQIENYRQMRRRFAEASVHARNFALQPMLDAKTGIFSEPEVAAKVRTLILGTYAKDPVVAKLFDAYLGAVPEDERKIVLGNILAGFSDRRGEQASLRTILEHMGPFGVKAGQFILSSGLGSPEVRKELDGIFDRALKPTRDLLFDRLEQALGRKLRNVEHVLPIAGSGSINFGAEVEMFDPQIGIMRKVVVRIQREYVEGLIGNENGNWERAIATLKNDGDAEVRKIAGGLEEARRHAVANLGPGGAELDLERERDLYGKARAAYEAPADAESGVRIEAARPLLHLQKLIPKNLSKVFSIYEYIENVPLMEVQPIELRRQLLKQIIGAEFRALFERGHFDPDGHPGNWLYDPKQKRLVRIDYGQLHELEPTEKKALRALFGSMVLPNASRAHLVDRLAGSFAEFWKVGGSPLDESELRAHLREIVARPEFPTHEAPHERLFFIRAQLESRLAREVTFHPSLQSALGSLLRLNVYRKELGNEPYVEMATRHFTFNKLQALRAKHAGVVPRVLLSIVERCRRALGIVD